LSCKRASLADDLRGLLAHLDDEDYELSAVMRHRLEGAVEVLDVVLRRRSGDSFGLPTSSKAQSER
jgi:hypothetical protein